MASEHGQGTVRLKRAYEPPEESDGRRILVERLWPRGVTKEKADLDAWMKEIAPSAELRKWYGHVVERWPEFQKRYTAELAEAAKKPLLQELAESARKGPVTLVYGAHDTEHNGAVVLRGYLKDHYRI
jgi:uncharacterized protein YeaO (DUF488 family)